jgi:hypothetical protein
MVVADPFSAAVGLSVGSVADWGEADGPQATRSRAISTIVQTVFFPTITSK